MNIRDVAESHLCCGCGACAYISPNEIEMVDAIGQGRRPLLRQDIATDPRSVEAMAVCPGVELRHTFDQRSAELVSGMAAAWGPVLGVWEGYAADDAIRFAGSSGGVATALALFCIEKKSMHGVLHIAARPDVPYLNHTVLSRTRGELLAATGSRYAPASPCDGLQMVEDAPAPCVFIGKPCDIAATHKARALRPALDGKLGLTIGIFCAGTPTTEGTLEMLRQMGVADPMNIQSLRYRGNGWPGNAIAIEKRDDGKQPQAMTYAKAWGDILQKHRQWRCHVCIDHSGEFADIAVGDPWYREIEPGDPGRSLIVVRTERGRQILRDAIAAGYLVAASADASIVEASQIGFPKARGAIWARLVVLKWMGAAIPRYYNMPMFRFWLTRLSIKEKLQSVYGTVKRVFRKGLRKRISIVPFEPDRQRNKELFLHDLRTK